MFSKEIFSERLRNARLENGISQVQLAAWINVSRSTIALMEIGERAPSIEVMCDLADVLGVTLDWLAGRDGYRAESVPEAPAPEVAKLLDQMTQTIDELRQKLSE